MTEGQALRLSPSTNKRPDGNDRDDDEKLNQGESIVFWVERRTAPFLGVKGFHKDSLSWILRWFLSNVQSKSLGERRKMRYERKYTVSMRVRIKVYVETDGVKPIRAVVKVQ
jgi:hypothetical protein